MDIIVSLEENIAQAYKQLRKLGISKEEILRYLEESETEMLGE